MADDSQALNSSPTLFDLGGSTAKPRPGPKHPTFAEVDLDEILYERRLEPTFRKAGIISFLDPLFGLLTEKGLRNIAYSAPIHVVKRDGFYFSFGGLRLLDEARRVLTAPRVYPVLVYGSVSSEDIVGQTLIEQIILVLWHRIWPKKYGAS
jgi:hypothetical protein